MKTFFTSDLHFGHKNVMKFCANTRPWPDVEQMNEALIVAWNSTVSATDTIYILGDFSFSKREITEVILKRLNGHKYLVYGNHDSQLREGWAKEYFVHRADYLRHKIEGQDVVMFHFPILEWEKCQNGSFHLYGHVHGKPMEVMTGRSLDVGWDAHGKILAYEDVCVILKDKPLVQHHFGGTTLGHNNEANHR